MNLGICLKKIIDHKATRVAVVATTLGSIAFPVGWKIKLDHIRDEMQENCVKEVERRELLLSAIIEKDAKKDPFQTLVQVKRLIYSLEIKGSEARSNLNFGKYPKPSVLSSVKHEIEDFPKQSGHFITDWFATANYAFKFLPSIRTDYGSTAAQRYLYEDEQYRAEKLLTKLKLSENRLLYLLNNEQLEKLQTLHLEKQSIDSLYGTRIADQTFYGKQWEQNALLYLNSKEISWIE